MQGVETRIRFWKPEGARPVFLLHWKTWGGVGGWGTVMSAFASWGLMGTGKWAQTLNTSCLTAQLASWLSWIPPAYKMNSLASHMWLPRNYLSCPSFPLCPFGCWPTDYLLVTPTGLLRDFCLCLWCSCSLDILLPWPAADSYAFSLFPRGKADASAAQLSYF